MKRDRVDRCRSAGCCKAFPLPPWINVEQLQAHPERFEDGETVAAMIYPVGAADPEGRPLWNCRNLDPVTNDCRIYATRPAMCREYPYGQRCPIVGCTLREACG